MAVQTSEDDDNPPAFFLTEKDRQNPARADSDFTPHTWAELRQIIATNDLSSLLRRPSSLRRYLAWTAATKSQYTTLTSYICQCRLHWTPLPSFSSSSSSLSSPDIGPVFETANPVPFADPRDYKILRNDWPYGVQEGITHLVVWLKNRLAVVEEEEDDDDDGGEEREGDLTDEAKGLVEAFIRRKFIERLLGKGEEDGDRVTWFRNSTGLQSVRGIEHVHVLVRGVGEDILEEWTGEVKGAGAGLGGG